MPISAVKLLIVACAAVCSAECAVYRQAYLVFSNKQQVDDAIKNFKREKARLDGRRLILIRWNPKRVLPNGSVTEYYCLMCCMCLCFVLCYLNVSSEYNVVSL